MTSWIETKAYEPISQKASKQCSVSVGCWSRGSLVGGCNADVKLLKEHRKLAIARNIPEDSDLIVRMDRSIAFNENKRVGAW